MYKLLALDIDGTLLNSKGEVCSTTLESVEEAKKLGVMVTISTGRPIQGVYKYIDMLGLEAPIITYNGAMIVDSVSNEIIYEQGLESKDAKQILDLAIDYGISIIIWSNNQLYVNRIDENVNNYKKLSRIEPIIVENYDDIVTQGITKILWIDEVEKVNDMMDDLQGKINKSVTFCTSKANYLEFFDQRVSKANALGRIGRHYQISKDEMMAIGDGDNDLTMIDYVGLGVAMENATPKVKKNAQFITTSNDNEGISNAIKKFITKT